jgi:hypothetical protein
MLIADVGIWCTAASLVERNGKDAPLEAAVWVVTMLEADDQECFFVCKQILKAVEELLRTEPGTGEVLH